MVLSCGAPEAWQVVVNIIHTPDKRRYILDIYSKSNIFYELFSSATPEWFLAFSSSLSIWRQSNTYLFFAIFSPNSYMTCSMPAVIYTPYKSSPKVTSDPWWAHRSQEVMDVTVARARLTASYVSTGVFRRRLQTYITWRTRSALDSGDGWRHESHLHAVDSPQFWCWTFRKTEFHTGQETTTSDGEPIHNRVMIIELEIATIFPLGMDECVNS